MISHGFCRKMRHVIRDSRSSKGLAGADIYLRFLQLTQAVRDLPTLPPLDPLEERILAGVAVATRTGERLSVRDLMAWGELAAPATLHSRLKSMREKGWILLADTEDTRRKQVQLTEEALRHLAQLSRAVVKAAGGR
jgi:hypothetical protein